MSLGESPFKIRQTRVHLEETLQVWTPGPTEGFKEWKVDDDSSPTSPVNPLAEQNGTGCRTASTFKDPHQVIAIKQRSSNNHNWQQEKTWRRHKKKASLAPAPPQLPAQPPLFAWENRDHEAIPWRPIPLSLSSTMLHYPVLSQAQGGRAAALSHTHSPCAHLQPHSQDPPRHDKGVHRPPAPGHSNSIMGRWRREDSVCAINSTPTALSHTDLP